MAEPQDEAAAAFARMNDGVGALIILVGLPASGKSFLARLLAARLGARLVQTDAVRKLLFKQPTYTPREHAAVYAECRRRVARALRRGETAVFDGTNLDEGRRRLMYKIADDAQALLVIVLLYASIEIVRQRLAARLSGADPLDQSDATWEVYRRLQPPEPITRPHLLVNSAVDLDQAVELVAARLIDRRP